VSQAESLYEKLGGQARVRDLLADFYRRVLDDPELAPFFEGVAIPHLIDRQNELFSTMLNGPMQYGGRSLAAVHHGRGITRQHFSRFCERMLDTLLEAGVERADADSVVVQMGIQVDNITGEPNVDG
jgi:hemoglobin